MSRIMRLAVLAFLAVALLLPVVGVAAQSEPPIPPVPVNGNYVVDQLNWLTPAQVAEINKVVRSLDQEGLAQIAVLTINDCGSDVSKYRYDVFNKWHIGHANDNDGLLIAVCWFNGDKAKRTVAQETGLGMEGTLPDTLVNKVAKEVFRPYSAVNKYGDGLVAMVHTYDTIIRKGDYNKAIASAVQPLKDNGTYVDPNAGSSDTSTKTDWLALLTVQVCGLQLWLWILIIIGVLTILYWIGIWTGIIEPGTFSDIMASLPSSSSSGDSDSSSFGGGSSGGGGANTGF